MGTLSVRVRRALVPLERAREIHVAADSVPFPLLHTTPGRINPITVSFVLKVSTGGSKDVAVEILEFAAGVWDATQS